MVLLLDDYQTLKTQIPSPSYMGTRVEDVLKVEGVTKRFGHRLILDDININVKKVKFLE